MPSNLTIKQLQIGDEVYNLKALNAANQSQNNAVVRDIQYGTNPPSGGDSGAMYLQYDTTETNNLYVYAEDTVGDQQNTSDLYYTKNEVNNLILDRFYPIGSIYLTVNSANPSTVIGGTWTQIAQGRTIFGAGTLNSITYTAGTTVNAGLPNISGKVVRAYSDFNKGNNNYSQYVSNPFYYNESEAYGTSWNVTDGTQDAIRNIYMDLSRSNSIFGNSTTVQPNAFVCYIWQRIG